MLAHGNGRSLNIGSQVAKQLANCIAGLHIKTSLSESPGQGGRGKRRPDGLQTHKREEQEF